MLSETSPIKNVLISDIKPHVRCVFVQVFSLKLQK